MSRIGTVVVTKQTTDLLESEVQAEYDGTVAYNKIRHGSPDAPSDKQWVEILRRLKATWQVEYHYEAQVLNNACAAVRERNRAGEKET